MVHLADERSAAALFVLQSLALCSPDSTLNGVGVKSAPEVSRGRPQIEPMQVVAGRGLERRIDRQPERDWSQLRVLPSAPCPVLLEALGQRPELLGIIDERITVIGK